MTSLISLFIKVITFVLIIIALSTFQQKKNAIKKVFKSINTAYKCIFSLLGNCIKKVMYLLCFLIVLEFLLIALQKCCLEDGRGLTEKNLLIAIALWILSLSVIYLLIGIFSALFLKIVDIIGNVKNDQIAAKMMMSFLQLSMLIFFSSVSESEMKENLLFLLLGVVICYILNIEILFKVVQNPFCLVGGKNQHKHKDNILIIISAILILLMFVANMYLSVLWVYYSYDGAYICSTGDNVITKWKLLYYTIISFTTIGYGDISPAIFESQVVSILIAITSVLCLVVFVSSVLSEKNEILNVNDG